MSIVTMHWYRLDKREKEKNLCWCTEERKKERKKQRNKETKKQRNSVKSNSPVLCTGLILGLMLVKTQSIDHH